MNTIATTYTAGPRRRIPAHVPQAGGFWALATQGLEGSQEDYRKHLENKYGKLTIQDVSRDQETLTQLGKRMGGHDVVIAPAIFQQMAADPKTAAYYEGKIDYFFHTIVPQETANCAAKGLVFQPAGVVVHKDGSVTYLCGCSDSPERVAKVNAINRARDEKRVALRQAALERAAQEAAERQALWAQAAEKRAQQESFSNIGVLLHSRLAAAPLPPLPQALPAPQESLFYYNLQ
jgi:hypothetical protein